MTSAEPVVVGRGLQRSVRLPGGRRLELLRGVDLTVEQGESVAIIGRSGSGKSTLLAILGLLSPPDAGELSIAGVNTRRLSDRRRSRLRNADIGFIFQSYSLVRYLSAAGNVQLPLRYGTPSPGRRRRKAADEALAAVGLTERRRSKPRHLSGGEQQRVAIARALVRRPRLILADEPTGALDVQTAQSVMSLLCDQAAVKRCALIVVTHDQSVAEMMTRRLWLADGILHETPEGQPA